MQLNTPDIIGMFKLFADLIAFHLDAHQRIGSSEADSTKAASGKRRICATSSLPCSGTI